MKKYSLKTIVDYVSGNEIYDYDIDDLENDSQFMMDVIDFTNDKNMYNLCPNIMKNNYSFILFMVNKFKNDLLFVNKIVKDFCEKSQDLFEQIEVRLALCSIAKSQDYDLYQENFLIVEALYGVMKYEVDNAVLDDPSLGEGFKLITYSFDFSELALNYFAKNFVEEIFSKYIKLDDFLHQHYNTYQEFEKSGVKSFIIKVLSRYDDELAAYVTQHIDVLDELIKKFERIKRNWNWYIENLKDKKYNMICDIVYNKLYESKSSHLVSGLELLFHFAEKYNFVDEIIEYRGFTREEYEEIIKESTLDTNDMDFELLKTYYDIQKEVVKILKQHNPEEPDDYVKDEKAKVKTNTIIDFKTKKIKKVNTY